MHGKTIAITGAVTSAEDLTIEGRIVGPVRCEGRTVVVAATAEVTGDILARDITVFGRAAGQLVATDIVDVRAGATLTGRVVSKRFVLDPAAAFSGRVEPQHLEAALRVAQFQDRQRDGDPSTR
jgi:cytoskeletal protein CcmA (bactofilin family)